MGRQRAQMDMKLSEKKDLIGYIYRERGERGGDRQIDR